MPFRPASREYRTWSEDSRRWRNYRPRGDDIVIATYPKAGTTWMQQIVALMIFRDPAPRPIMEISPWIDRRGNEPPEATFARIEGQTHRRFLKSHLPADGLPIHDEVRYIHVARDGRDACLSFHNHRMSLTPEILEGLDQAGLADEAIGRPYPRVSDPAEAFHAWLTEGVVAGQTDGSPMMSFFDFELSWWAERERMNVLLVHHGDLKRDLETEMRRIAEFLGIAIPPELWPVLVAAAGFDAMRREGAKLMGRVADIFHGGAADFFHRGANGRWRELFRPEDLARYETEAAARLPADCAQWLERGSLGAPLTR